MRSKIKTVVCSKSKSHLSATFTDHILERKVHRHQDFVQYWYFQPFPPFPLMSTKHFLTDDENRNLCGFYDLFRFCKFINRVPIR